MIISPYVFKTRALRALKGNWQTALLVSFFSTLPMTIVQLYQTTQLPDVSGMLSLEAAQAAIAAVDAQVWLLLGLLGGLSLVITPVLSLGRHQYFIQRLQKQELGFVGLFSRMGSFGKALLLYVLIYVKVFLWSLLFIVPGIIAALRYSLAPLYLAQDPQMGVFEALNRSKAAMRDKKTDHVHVTDQLYGVAAGRAADGDAAFQPQPCFGAGCLPVYPADDGNIPERLGGRFLPCGFLARWHTPSAGRSRRVAAYLWRQHDASSLRQ